MAVFVLELCRSAAVHPVQYLFVGLAMIFFYVLLLSLAEQIGFPFCLLIAAAASGCCLSLSTSAWRLQSRWRGMAMLAVFAVPSTASST